MSIHDVDWGSRNKDHWIWHYGELPENKSDLRMVGMYEDRNLDLWEKLLDTSTVEEFVQELQPHITLDSIVAADMGCEWDRSNGYPIRFVKVYGYRTDAVNSASP